MPKPKIYATSISVTNDRVRAILGNSKNRAEAYVYVVASTKADALKQIMVVSAYGVAEKDLRVSGFDSHAPLMRAGLLADLGTMLLVPVSMAFDCPVARHLAGQSIEQIEAIGMLSQIDTGVPGYGGRRRVFETTLATVATNWSIVASQKNVYIKYPTGWISPTNSILTDQELQLRLDMGDVKMVRVGMGDWYPQGS